MDGMEGIEPSFLVSKTIVLPLDDTPIWRKRWVTIPLGVAPGLRLATGRDSYLPLFLNMENRVGFEPTVGFLLRLKRPLHSANFATGPNMVGVMGVEPTASQFQTEDATVTPHPVKW